MAEIVDFPHFCLKHIQKEAKLNQTQKYLETNDSENTMTQNL